MGAVLAGGFASVTGIAGVAAACGGSCLGMCCGHLAGSGSIEDVSASRRMYFGLQAFALLLIWLLRSVAEKWFSWLPSGITDCTDVVLGASNGTSEIFGYSNISWEALESDAVRDSCYKEQMTLRVTCVVVFLSILLLFFSALGLHKQALLHYWFAKYALVPVATFGLLFVPNSFFILCVEIAQFSSILFSIAQVTLLLDFGHVWNDTWILNNLEDQRSGSSGLVWKTGIVVAALSFLAFGLTVTGVAHAVFAISNDYTSVVLWVNFSFGLLFILLSSINQFPHASLLPACLVFAYMTLISWQACLAYPVPWKGEVYELDNQFVRITSDIFKGDSMRKQSVAAQVFALLFLCTALVSYVNPLRYIRGNGDLEEQVEDVEIVPEVEGEKGETKKDVHVPYLQTVLFFAVHTLSTLYVITIFIKKPSMISFWVQASTNWVMIVLVAWTLIGPFVVSGRDW